ncbi:MAG: citrate synthase [Gammaproteobacteria bacterium]|jgi:citrate synthase
MPTAATPHTHLCSHNSDAIFVRGRSLVDDVIGRMGFTEMIYLMITGKTPGETEVKVIDAVLVTLMEHGMTPSAIAARMVYSSAPESVQAGVSAGLLAVGSVFVGTMEGCAANIQRMLDAADPQAEAHAIATQHHSSGTPLPGFGHPFHRPDDPRSPRLFEVAAQAGVRGDHVAALKTLSVAVDEVYGRHLTINATGAIAALLGEVGLPAQIMRGMAVISRAAGLVAHIAEEQQDPAMLTMWHAAEHSVPYADDQS